MKELTIVDYGEVDLSCDYNSYYDEQDRNYRFSGFRTDFVNALGFCSNHPDAGNEYTKECSRKGRVLTLDCRGDENYFIGPIDPRSRNGAIRPALRYSDIKDYATEYVETREEAKEEYDNGKLGKVVQYGEYPQDPVIGELEEKINELDRYGRLKKTGKVYTVDSVECLKEEIGFDGYSLFPYKEAVPDKLSYGKEFVPRVLEEVELDGRKFVKLPVNRTFKANFFIDKGTEYIWFEVKPLVWIVDEEKDIAVCKDSILSGIPFSYKRKYDGNFEETFLHTYLQKYLSREIEPTEVYLKEQAIKKDDNKDYIVNLIEQIKNLLTKYKDLDNNKYIEYAKDINKNLDILVKAYNKKLEELSYNSRSLNLVLEDENMMTANLIVKLEAYLDGLNGIISPVKDSYLMLNILKGNTTEEVVDDDLYADLKVIESETLPYLGKEESAKQYRDFINNEIVELEQTIKEGKGLSLNYLKIKFRKKLQPYLAKLNIAIQNKSYVNEIIEEAGMVSSKSVNNYKTNLFRTINDNIKGLIKKFSNTEYAKDLDRVLERYRSIDENTTVDDTLEIMSSTFKELAGMEFEYDTKQKEVDNIRSRMI